jgi:hypothetical protein
MNLAKDLGYPRPESTTPLEFLPDLNSIFPGESDNLHLITHSFIKIRYGQLPESKEDVKAVQTAWQSIRSRKSEFKKRLEKTNKGNQ